MDTVIIVSVVVLAIAVVCVLIYAVLRGRKKKTPLPPVREETAAPEEPSEQSEAGQEPALIPKTLPYAADEVKHLTFQDDHATYLIFPSEEENVQIDLVDNEETPYEITLTDGKLEIKRPRKNAGNSRFRRNAEKETAEECMEVRIALPKTFGSLSVSTVHGDIDVKKLALSDLSLQTTHGDISMFQVKVTGEVPSPSDVNFNAKTTKGNILADRSGSLHGAVNFTTVNGSVKFFNLYGKNILAKSVDGDVKGFIIGVPEDYTVISTTIHGEKVVPRSYYGPNLLKASSVNGDIDVDFRSPEEAEASDSAEQAGS